MPDMRDSDATQSLTLRRMILSGIRHGWRTAASVALGVGTATAVIVGALLVGDSMRGSLRELTVERLGKTEAAVIPGGFFDIEGITRDDLQAIPLILFDAGVVEVQGDDGTVRARAGSVQIIGCDERFWQLDVSGNRPSSLPDDNSVVLNESTARELGVEVGQLVTLRLPVEQAVPADSPLGRRDIQTEGLPRMKVVDIIPDRGLGRFAISPNQAAPRNIYVRRETVGDALDRTEQANVLLFDQPVAVSDLQIDLHDLGLSLKRVQREFTADDGTKQIIYDYYSLTSDRLLLPEGVVKRIASALPAEEVTEMSTYLANAMERLDESGEVVATVPYSTITAVDSSPGLPLNYDAGEASGKDRIPLVLNRWAADRLGAEVGTPLRIAYYEPEVENGNEIERSFRAVVTDIVPITRPATPYRRRREATFDQPPTVYNDPDLTPTVPGVTDQDSISDWDLPFQLDREIAKEDDLYWNEYRLTPKAFLPLADGQRLFGSRFGQTTGLRIAAGTAESADQLRSRLTEILTPELDELGWTIRPLRQTQLAASRGTTPFDGLFLALSFFVIMAAVMLIAMLFRLGLVQRMKQFGTLMAVGWSPRRIAALALGEGLLVAAIGTIIGLAGGVLYAVGVLWALRHWWVGAVTVPFLTFHWTPVSLIVGALAGWLVAAVTLAVTARWLVKIDAQSLLSGRDLDSGVGRSAQGSQKQGRRLPVGAAVIGGLAVTAAALGAAVGGQAAAGGFVGGGMLLLVAALLSIYSRLRHPRRISNDKTVTRYSLGALSARNASRHPLRSTMTIGLMATAAFLIIAISAFRLQPSDKGTGGFTLIGQSSQPLYRDLRDPKVRSDLLGRDAPLLAETVIAPMRMRPGQDASCNNLYQATRPTVLGVPESLADEVGEGSRLPGFEWAARESDTGSPWAALHTTASGTADDPIPVIIDQNTAMWSLQMTGGIGQTRTFEYTPGNEVTFRVVGLLANSVLQGRLMIGESNFEQLFPEISGYRFFLIADDPAQSEQVASTLESRLGDIGMDLSDAREVLSGMLAVQNTYLRTFQSLGALGLLLGTIGLAVAQLRSVLERRRELAVMRAIGFTRQRLAAVVLTETASLLLLGIGAGAICAMLAVLPHAILNDLVPPVVEPLLIVAGIILFGMLAGLVAVRRVARMPLLESLRSE